MSFEELENSELERMKFNAFKVCNELMFRIEAVPAPGGYMKAYTLERNEYLFFNNHQLSKNYVAASENTRMALPGSHYFKMLETFIEKHFEIGEKYLEYVRYACLDPSCYHCSALGWAGPVCSRIPKPMPNYNSSGFHYLSVFETPVEVDGNTRPVDDFQPRKQVKDYMAQGKLVTEEEIDDF
jgi:hypothetical protein